MGAPLPHRVRRQVIDLTVAEHSLAARLYAEMSGALSKAIAPVLDEVFTEFCPTGTTLRIERVEVDLGLLPGDDWLDTLTGRLKQRLRELLEVGAPGRFANGEIGVLERLSEIELRTERLLQFLRTGATTVRQFRSLPEQVAEDLRTLMLQEPDALARALTTVPRSILKRRLMEQFEPVTRSRVASLMQEIWPNDATPNGMVGTPTDATRDEGFSNRRSMHEPQSAELARRAHGTRPRAIGESSPGPGEPSLAAEERVELEGRGSDVASSIAHERSLGHTAAARAPSRHDEERTVLGITHEEGATGGTVGSDSARASASESARVVELAHETSPHVEPAAIRDERAAATTWEPECGRSPETEENEQRVTWTPNVVINAPVERSATRDLELKQSTVLREPVAPDSDGVLRSAHAASDAKRARSVTDLRQSAPLMTDTTEALPADPAEGREAISEESALNRASCESRLTHGLPEEAVTSPRFLNREKEAAHPTAVHSAQSRESTLDQASREDWPMDGLPEETVNDPRSLNREEEAAHPTAVHSAQSRESTPDQASREAWPTDGLPEKAVGGPRSSNREEEAAQLTALHSAQSGEPPLDQESHEGWPTNAPRIVRPPSGVESSRSLTQTDERPTNARFGCAPAVESFQQLVTPRLRVPDATSDSASSAAPSANVAKHESHYETHDNECDLESVPRDNRVRHPSATPYEGDPRACGWRSETVESQYWPRDERTALFVAQSGLVILWPFLAGFLEHLGLAQNRRFVDDAARERAVGLVAHLADGENHWNEQQLVLAKLLCGFPLFEPIAAKWDLTALERGESERLLRSVTSHWPGLSNTSVKGFRQSFLSREGALLDSKNGWSLKVTRLGYDVLLERLPWGIGVVMLPWMERPIYVEW